MPVPRNNENREDFVNRCIPVVLNDGTASNQNQAVAICNSLFLNRNDAVAGNFDELRNSVNSLLTADKSKYSIIIKRFIQESFDDALRTVEQELSLQANSLTDFNKANSRVQVLKDNAITINYELFDAINKEITLMLTNIELNNIPFTNAGIKREVQTIFDKFSARLASQVLTETTRATNEGLKFGYEQSGVITHKQWVAVIDDKTTSICLDGNGEIRQIGEPFSTGDYNPPFHINCRSRIQGLTISQVKELS